jgi:pyridoxal phosphate enzyme (YggS family)
MGEIQECDLRFDIVGTVPRDLKTNLAAVQARIEKAATAAGRSVDEIKLVSVSKTHPVPVLREAIAAGATAFGENKIQEGEDKIVEIGRGAVEWHLIGHLQSNKARRAVQLFDVIHSVDSLELATRLERICVEENRARLPVLIQVGLAGEETKSGVAEANLSRLVDYLKLCRRLSFDGLMILPPYFENAEDVRPYFQQLRKIRDRLALENAFGAGAGELSMGMSHDFEIAIEEGATMVRVGTAIFGERSPA